MTNPVNCPHCGQPLAPDASRLDAIVTCPHCGAPASPPFAVPWEHRHEIGFWAALFQTNKMVLRSPSRFFSHMPATGGFKAPLIFALIVGTAVGWLGIASEFLPLLLVLLSPSPPLSSPQPSSLLPFLAAYILLLPAGLALLTFTNAVVLHSCLTIVGGAGRNFETTFRTLCYSYAVSAWLLIPCFGPFVAPFWALFSQIIGLSHAHAISSARAALAVFLGLAIDFVLLCGVIYVILTLFPEH